MFFEISLEIQQHFDRTEEQLNAPEESEAVIWIAIAIFSTFRSC